MAAGYATRLRPLTDSIPKMLLPLAGRPMLDYLVDRIEEVDEIDEIHVVTNARFAGDLAAWASGRAGTRHIAVWNDGTVSNEDRLGAIGDLRFTIERGKLEGEELLVVAGDNLIEYSLEEFVHFWRGKGDGSAIAVRRVADEELIKQYGVAELAEDDRIVSLEEKPSRPRSDIAVTATYLFPAEHAALISPYLDGGNPKDAPGNFVVWLYPRVPVYGYRFEGGWMDIGDPKQLLEADNRLRARAGLPPRDRYVLGS
ncbi:MAG TPA: nucleotidyltransferase family protein [Gaiellaceae bacterium]|nr:nucleotidyltransferase family protein [Gaiellaceae bacterium]